MITLSQFSLHRALSPVPPEVLLQGLASQACMSQPLFSGNSHRRKSLLHGPHGVGLSTPLTRLSRLDSTKDQSGAGEPHPTVMMREGKRALGNLELGLDVGGVVQEDTLSGGVAGAVIQSQTGSG